MQWREVWVRHTRTKKEKVICSVVTNPHSRAPKQQTLNPLINTTWYWWGRVGCAWRVGCLLSAWRQSAKKEVTKALTPQRIPFPWCKAREAPPPYAPLHSALWPKLQQETFSGPRQAQNQTGWVCWVLIWFSVFLVLFSGFLDHFSWCNTKF